MRQIAWTTWVNRYRHLRGAASAQQALRVLACDAVGVSVTRLVQSGDAPILAALLRENRAFLKRWHPRRGDRYFAEEGQAEAVDAALGQHAAGVSVPLVITDGPQVVGAITIQSIIRGFFQSCSVGFWLAESAQGRGLATAALRETVALAFGDLRLHRVQAETLPDNARSQAVLERVGFTRYGVASQYLKIDGEWRDHALLQLLCPDPDNVAVPD